MTIERLDLPGGIPKNDRTATPILAGRLLIQRADQISILEAGTYDITPVVDDFAEDTRSKLTVLEDGTAIYSARNPNKTTLWYGAPEGLIENNDNVTVLLPEYTPLLAILGKRRKSPTIVRLFSIIHWKPEETIEEEAEAEE
jgi:hypothetical protein